LAEDVAKRAGLSMMLLDGPPGIGCPVHATLTGVDAVLVVTEPTPSAEHDFTRLMALLGHFTSDVAVVINKYDLASRGSGELERLCERLGVPVVARVPFDRRIPQLLSEGRLPLEAGEETQEALSGIHDWIVSLTEGRDRGCRAEG
jgi:MinD superfamily P-loop ATPase